MGLNKEIDMNYTVKKIEDKYCVIETATDHVIQSHKNKKNALDLRDKYNNGIGFDGWTPAFIVNKFLVPQENT
jgi:hypothetical protein